MLLNKNITNKEFSSHVEDLLPDLRSFVSSHITNKSDALDVLQNTLFILWKKRDQFDPTKGSFKNFALSIAYWQIRGFFTEFKRNREFTSSDYSFLSEKSSYRNSKFLHSTCIEQAELLNLRNSILQKCYQNLSKRNQLIAVLHFKKGCSRKHLCKIFNKSDGFMSATLHRIKRSMVNFGQTLNK
jgi:RNA polymerase sigma factor (sigma-70 family)